ncbi:pyruvate kinase [Desulfitispora alkaliphila]|uniref:pyruvate kinase n=1 Tax=Desulfitispora alkaliphila TaxID=622674 RepID=UPI003D1E94BD
MKKTKIVCTIGPATETVSKLKELIAEGMNVARLNFSHGDYEEHGKRIDNIRQATLEVGRDIAIMLDTKGPEIRLGKFANDAKIKLEVDQEFTLTVDEIEGDESKVQVSYEGLPQDVNPGTQILIDDGLVSLEVVSIEGNDIKCRVINAGEISSRKGVNVPGVKINLPALTEKDIADLHFGIDRDVDFIAASFIRKASDVLAIKEILEAREADIHVISKIENQEGVDNIEDILKVSDGIMVARGDLGVEIPAEEVPLVQKVIIELCNNEAIPVITATQMLDSMMRNPRPTRAEASDVANAIIDGSDAIMLSGETAAGKYPVESVRTMAQIANRTEQAIREDEQREKIRPEHTVTDSIGYATCSIATDLDAEAIITATVSGSTARVVAKYRPRAPIIAATPSRKVLRQLNLVNGVLPIFVNKTDGTDETIRETVSKALIEELISTGDLVVVTAGVPVGMPGTTNLIKVHVVGEIVAQGTGIGKGAISGKVVFADSGEEAVKKVAEGDILVTVMTDKDFIPAIEKAGVIVTEQSGITSHAALVAINMGKPVVLGIGDNVKNLYTDMVVTVDVSRGLIYRGTAKIL